MLVTTSISAKVIEPDEVCRQMATVAMPTAAETSVGTGTSAMPTPKLAMVPTPPAKWRKTDQLCPTTLARPASTGASATSGAMDRARRTEP